MTSATAVAYAEDETTTEPSTTVSPATADTPDKKVKAQIIETDFDKLSAKTDIDDLKSLYDYF